MKKMLFYLCFYMIFVEAVIRTDNNADNHIEVEKVENSLKSNPNIEADVDLTTPQLIEKYGYVGEIHHVLTSDGYILELHRIIAGPKSPSSDGKQPVLLMHGLMDSSATFLIMRPNNGLGYILSDEGFDVWLGNNRGNIYSRRHETLNPDGSRKEKAKFWDYTFHEIGIYDIPASIDYILSQTGNRKLHYVGHSQGTSAYLAMTSIKPEYNDKIIFANLLSPVAYMSNLKSPLVRALLPLLLPWQSLYNMIGATEFNPPRKVMKSLVKHFCHDEILCPNLIFLVAGYSEDQLNTTMLPIIFGHFPAGASFKQFGHYGQEIRSGYFRQFDYGPNENRKYYDSAKPPNYNLNNVKAPVVLYYSGNDGLAAQEDVKKLISELPNVQNATFIPGFNHVDFIWGIDAPELVYQNIIRDMRKAESIIESE